MLESLAAWVLKYFLGKYVENLNTDQLTIGLLQGEVELENLPLKKEALRQVGLPIQVTAGFIGKVKLQIPFTQLRSAPWTIIIEKIYLVAAPVNLSEWDEDAEDQALLEQKLSVLDAIEAQWRSSTEGLDQSYYASSYTSWMNFGTSVVSNIVENLQLKICDVHIRYEDNLTVDHKMFTFGLVIESIVAESCNKTWTPGSSHDQNTYKLLQLTNLCLYWQDCSSSDFLGEKDPSEFIAAMASKASRGSQFILNCLSGTANLTKNRSPEPLRSRATPRLICDVLFEDFPLSLSDQQYSQMVGFLKGLNVIEKRISLRHLRPACTVREDAKKWWQYMYYAVSEGNQVARVKCWDVALKRASDNVAYVKTYEKLLLNPAGALSEEQKALKDRVENEQTLDELRALRVAAMQRIRPVGKSAPTSPKPTTNYLSAWFPQYWYSNSTSSGDDNEEMKINEELIEMLDNSMDDTMYTKRDVVFGQFNFSLKEGTITLSSASKEDPNVLQSLIELQLEKVQLGFESRPRNSSYKLNVTLGGIFLKDKLTSDTIFPVLVAPQGRDIAPSSLDAKRNLPPGLARLINLSTTSRTGDESLLQLVYEVKPHDSNVDCRLHIKTQSLDIVYNPALFAWLTDYFTKPQQSGSNLRLAARKKYQEIKAATKIELIRSWEEIIAGDLTNRKTWDIDLDISAPQIILVEHFCDKNAAIVVVDLGRFHFSNCAQQNTQNINKKDSDEDEAFATPCSTPPGSEASPEDAEPPGIPISQLNELNLHAMLYEQYVVELSDIQVLVGHVRDSWKYAQLKGSSSLHVLDKFNITMQVERRLVYTTDPQYPSLTFSGNLPRLVVHVNEQKILSLRAMYNNIIGSGSLSPSPQESAVPYLPQDDHLEAVRSETSRLVIMQFTFHHLSLEVQSRNRSVAELQVSGVRAAFTQRPFDTCLTLTVHSLLLVDALQTFGRDFELLIASHKHVGMDSLSGSLRDSEPCSPTSPGSPEPGDQLASPYAISLALTDLEGNDSFPRKIIPTSPVNIASPPLTAIRPASPELADTEALIMIELTFINGQCPGHDGQPLQIATVQFNNLDIIANQETIVELLGFTRRVFPQSKASAPTVALQQSEMKSTMGKNSPSEAFFTGNLVPTQTEATFDFHRLNVLLLRAAVKDGVSVGRKICTATMMEAKIKATVGDELVIEGSLGGIHVFDLTPDGTRHQRILSLGADPLAENDKVADLSAGLYTQSFSSSIASPAFSFSVRRLLKTTLDDCVDVRIRLASVWYTHSPQLLRELQSCAAEFKQYLSNLAKSIRSAATEMAMGIVHARAEALALSLSVSNRISSSLYGGSTSDVGSPKKRRSSFTQSVESIATYAQTPFTPHAVHTPWSPEDNDIFDTITINLDVEMDTPVIVLPESPNSDHVFVAHLGKITLRNSYPERDAPWESRVDKYHIEIRDMSVHSVIASYSTTNLSLSASGEPILPRPEKLYSTCGGKAILHDTAIDLAIERTVILTMVNVDNWDLNFDGFADRPVHFQINGGIVSPLMVSLNRDQYQQVLETFKYLLTSLTPQEEPSSIMSAKKLMDIEEEESSIDSSFDFTSMRRPPTTHTSKPKATSASGPSYGVIFEVPEFTVKLFGELTNSRKGALVSISFRDFMLTFNRPNSSSTHLQMSLKSLLMEDLLVTETSKNRFLVVSSAAPVPVNRRFALSRSCPSLSRCPILVPEHSSLPDNLTSNLYCGKPQPDRRSNNYSNQFGLQLASKSPPCTPPPSPRPGKASMPVMNRAENLVLITVDTVNHEEPDNVERCTRIDFNCLDVIANIESWVVVFDFFGFDHTKQRSPTAAQGAQRIVAEEVIQTGLSTVDLEVRSLTLIMVRPEYEVCKANISHLVINTRSTDSFDLEGRLGSMSLTDLSPHGKLYRERFATSGKEALHVRYTRHGSRKPDHDRPCDSELSIKMSSVVYLHTQRFLNELYAYFNRFTQLQTLMASMRSSDNESPNLQPSSRMLLCISAGSPVLILPVASVCSEVLVADFGELTVRNGFRRAGSVGTIASSAPEGTANVRCLLDVMTIELVNMDLFTGSRLSHSTKEESLRFGGLRIRRDGPSLLTDKCHLKLQVDRNLDTHLSREVPDLTIQGTLTKLEANLDLAQYKVIRGLLSYNIGENLQDLIYLSPETTSRQMEANIDKNEPRWRTLSIHLDLVNVVVHLREKHFEGNALASINFIRSRLAVDSFSDRSQDIDLVSAEILLTDTRYLKEPMNKRCNVFTNILQSLGAKSTPRSSSFHKLGAENVQLEKKPSQDSEDGLVQAEVHHRRRKEYSKATVLLHNMRVMAVLDWWETIRDFIAQNQEIPGYPDIGSLRTSKTGHGTAAAYAAGLKVADKYPAMIDSDTAPFEFKLNVTDSEIVLVEDTSAWDTNALILKSTTVISYRPGLLEKPLSCNLNHCELFSCLLGLEEETALSIIDPVTINMEVALRTPITSARGISDAVLSSKDRVLEVSLQQLNIRLSYHDFRMLSRMMESVPLQTKKARSSASNREDHPANIRSQINKLSSLGFCEEDCANALERCNGLDEAALWLTQNAAHTLEKKSRPDTSSAITFDTTELKLACLSIVVIDDCRDSDVPLLEISLSQMHLRQMLNGEGTAKFHFTSDYYNRVLSGWEPFVESWRCNMKWEKSLTSGLARNRLQLEISSDDLVNVNITSTLLELYSMVKNSWFEDYNEQNTNRPAIADDGSVSALTVRRRSPFVPFALKNETGCQLWFRTLIKTGDNSTERMNDDDSWIEVNPDETVPFTFEGRERARHRDTHKVRVHQVSIKVGVWGPTSPVSIDKVGVVFRHAPPLAELTQMDVPPARLIFSVTLEGTARKLVTVRSALTINNQLGEAVEAKLENTFTYPGVWDDTVCLHIPANTSFAVPLNYAHSHIWIRPLDSISLRRYHAFSSSTLGWMSATNPRELVHETHQCHSNRDKSYRFVAAIYHEDLMNSPRGLWLQPAHTISLYSPVVIVNLLPCDLYYALPQASVRGHVKPGLSANIHEVDCEQRMEINFQVEGFPRHGTLILPPSIPSFRGDVRLQDERNRRLLLNVSVDMLQGAGVRISVFAPFWVLNKTSLPLVVRQEGGAQEAAGQGPETEVARVVSPLLFSLADSDGGPMAQLRVGHSLLPDSQAQWCQPFPLHLGTAVLRLRVGQRDRPDVIYIIGINIRTGKGRYRRTKIITLTPRFQLHNKSSFQIQFSQMCLATTLNDPAASATYGKAVQDCSLAWHWPRLDKDLLLAIRLPEVKDCLWSGGFAIDKDDSFHVNVRDVHGKMHFLRAEIVLQGATYFTVLTDADNMPPPVRIDNCSQVPVDFFQVDSKIETVRSSVRPQSSLSYAWDLPHGHTKLTVIAPGGSSATYEINEASTKSNTSLTYENFIYIAFTATFNNTDVHQVSSGFEPLDVESQQLVLDCIDGRRVVLNRKQQGARSQLWCMTADGQLQHEGSSPPRDPKQKSSRSSASTMVLDIAGTAPQPSQCVSLVLRRPDQRRSSTQTWRFTDDGRLCCAHNSMCVQAKDGFFGLRQGNEAVLGPKMSGLRCDKVPIEQAVSRMKMRPGSGCLVVSVASDGPTRVLRIIDPIDNKVNEKSWSASIRQEDECTGQGELQVNIKLNSGLGISIVSRAPSEELLFVHLKGIILDASTTPFQTTFDCSIEDLQCDNQLFEPECSVVLYVTQSYRDDEPRRHLPAVLISAHKQHSLNSNAHIFKELLLLKLFAMFGPPADTGTEDAEESDFETQRRVMEATSVHAARYYFEIIKLTPDQIRLSYIVATSSKLPPHLKRIKKKLGLRLIKFEDAAVDLKEFKRRHPFETSQCLLGSIVKHFKTELTWQAAVILGTVDLLGNPLGLINDVSEGVTNLLSEGNVGALVKNVTHGLSNSAAKVTESLSDGLGRVILDESHEEARQRIRKTHSGSSSEHLWVGLRGLGFGVVGGVTSIIKQTYEGLAQDGIQGLLPGLGKGLLGTVTKPVVGFLDLASGAASAVRDSSRTSDRPPRFRLPRLVLGPGGLMPPYSALYAAGQDLLYSINNRNYLEKLVSYEVLLSEGEDLRILVSSEQVLLITSAAIQVAQYHLSTLSHCEAVSVDESGTCLHYIELVLHLSAGSGIITQDPPKKRPRIRCDSKDVAEKVCQHVNYAQALFEETRYTVACYPELLSP